MMGMKFVSRDSTVTGGDDALDVSLSVLTVDAVAADVLPLNRLLFILGFKEDYRMLFVVDVERERKLS